MPPSKSWQEIDAAILAELDLRREYESLGVEVTGGEPNARGWVPCRAVGRDDREPSAAINVLTGRYKDAGGTGLSLNLWEFAAQFGPHADWREARKHFARQTGVKLPRGKPPKDPAEKLKFRPWSEAFVSLWCRHKPPISPAAVRAAGGRLATYRDQYTVIALPILGPGGVDQDPVGWVLWNTTGRELPVFRKGQSQPSWTKMLTTYGSESGLLGQWALDRLDPQDCTNQTIWMVEGPADMLAAWTVLPETLRDRHLVLTNAGGANESPKPWMADIFRGRRVVVIRDADKAGEAGGEKWSRWLAGVAEAVRWPRLPYPVAESHGPDLRDWLGEGHTFAELAALAREAPNIQPPPEAADGEPGAVDVQESDTDPYRLARVYLQRYGHDPDFGQIIRFYRDEWWKWDGRRYRKIPSTDLRAALTAGIKEEFDRINRQVLADWRSDDPPPDCHKVTTGLVTNTHGTLIAASILPSDVEMPYWLDRSGPPTCLALANCILDLDRYLTGAADGYRRNHSPQWFSDTALPYPFDENADCPIWKRTLSENLCGNEELLNLLQEWAGYLLRPNTDLRKFLILQGEGRNGKGAFCAGIEAMLGEENVSHTQLESLGQQFGLECLQGKLANIVPDCNEVDSVAEGILKSLTSGDTIQVNRKFLRAIDMRPTARMILAANMLPRFHDRTKGIWSRMLFVPFENEIEEGQEVQGMDKVDWWQKSGELPGIFNWAIAGLHRLRQQGHFTRAAACEEAIEDYRQDTNSARAFLTDECLENPAEGVSSGDLYEAYKSWCRRNGNQAYSARQFGKEVKRTFRSVDKRRLGGKNDRFYYYQGISLKPELV